VLHMTSITEREGSRLPAAAVYLLGLSLESLHRRDLFTVKIDLLVDAVLKEELRLHTRLSHKGKGRCRGENESSGDDLHGDMMMQYL